MLKTKILVVKKFDIVNYELSIASIEGLGVKPVKSILKLR